MQPDLAIDLSLQREYLQFLSHPEELEARLNPLLNRPGPQVVKVLVDEVQRIPDLLNTVQAIVDKEKGKVQFLLCGSSARKLKRGAANLLPGRVLTYRLGPLSCSELDYKMKTDQALEMGCLPEVYLSEDRQFSAKLLDSYSGTYLQEEILAEAVVQQVQGFSRFLSIVAMSSGHFLDFSKLANRAKVNRSAARRFFQILEDSLVCDRLDAFDGEATKDLRLVRHSKFYLFDVGITNALLNNYNASLDRRGLLCEHLFFNQLKNTAHCFDCKPRISHFRTVGGLEVDFLIELNGRRIAVEVKSSEPSAQELEPLKRLPGILGNHLERYVACFSEVPERQLSGIDILPWQQVVKRIFEHKQ